MENLVWKKKGKRKGPKGGEKGRGFISEINKININLDVNL